MKPLVLLFAALPAMAQMFPFPGPGTAPTAPTVPNLVNHTSAQGASLSVTTVTTNPINCTGATLEIISVSNPYGTTMSPTDSSLNTGFTKEADWANCSSGGGGTWYLFHPTVSNSMTFSAQGGNGSYGISIAAACYSGAFIGAVDVTSPTPLPTCIGGTASNAPVGSMTPNASNELLVTIFSDRNTTQTHAPNALTISSSNGTYTITDTAGISAGGSGYFAVLGQAWQVQNPAAAMNPTWSTFTDAGLGGAVFQFAVK